MTATDTAPAPAPATPAPAKPKRGRPAKDATPEINLTDLEFAVVDKMPRKTDGTPNPFRQPLADSYEYEKPRATKVPKDAVSWAEGKLRRAALELEIGVSIATGEPGEDGKVEIIFQGKDRRKRKSKTEPTADAPADAGEQSGDAPASETTPDAGDSPSGESAPAA